MFFLLILALLSLHNERLGAKSVRKADGVKNGALIYVGEWNRCGYDFVIMQLTEKETTGVGGVLPC